MVFLKKMNDKGVVTIFTTVVGGCIGAAVGGVVSLATGWIGWENMFGCIASGAVFGTFIGLGLTQTHEEQDKMRSYINKVNQDAPIKYRIDEQKYAYDMSDYHRGQRLTPPHYP